MFLPHWERFYLIIGYSLRCPLTSERPFHGHMPHDPYKLIISTTWTFRLIPPSTLSSASSSSARIHPFFFFFLVVQMLPVHSFRKFPAAFLLPATHQPLYNYRHAFGQPISHHHSLALVTFIFSVPCTIDWLITLVLLYLSFECLSVPGTLREGCSSLCTRYTLGRLVNLISYLISTSRA